MKRKKKRRTRWKKNDRKERKERGETGRRRDKRRGGSEGLGDRKRQKAKRMYWGCIQRGSKPDICVLDGVQDHWGPVEAGWEAENREQRATDIERSNILKSSSAMQTCAMMFWRAVLSLNMFSTVENWMEPSPLPSQLHNRQGLCSRLSGWASEHLHGILLMNRLNCS